MAKIALCALCDFLSKFQWHVPCMALSGAPGCAGRARGVLCAGGTRVRGLSISPAPDGGWRWTFEVDVVLLGANRGHKPPWCPRATSTLALARHRLTSRLSNQAPEDSRHGPRWRARAARSQTRSKPPAQPLLLRVPNSQGQASQGPRAL